MNLPSWVLAHVYPRSYFAHRKIHRRQLRFRHLGLTLADFLKLGNSLLNFLVVNFLYIPGLTQHNTLKLSPIKSILTTAERNLLGLISAGQNIGQHLFLFSVCELNGVKNLHAA
jgi:hypothetical protein